MEEKNYNITNERNFETRKTKLNRMKEIKIKYK